MGATDERGPDPGGQTTLTPAVAGRAAVDAWVPTLTILSHPDPARVGEVARLADLAFGEGISLSRLEPRFGHPGEPSRRPLDDPYVSRKPLRIDPVSDDRLRLTDGGAGVVVEGEPLEPAGCLVSATNPVVLELADRVTLVLQGLEPDGEDASGGSSLRGQNPAMRRLRRTLEQIAPHDATVLIHGESGTGKELAAQAIHELSGRPGAFVSVNVGAIPAPTATSALFGHVRGAFTGAGGDALGYFAAADRGTLFLDEIGEAPPEVQVMLLRALESGEIQPVGAARSRRVDVRLVAATDVDLRAAVDRGRFRLPLLQRLAVLELTMPPLRHRRDDVGRLLYGFLKEDLRASGAARDLSAPDVGNPLWLSAGVVGALARHDWPGNVRELRNVARRIAITAADAESVSLEGILGAAAPRDVTEVRRTEPAPAPKAKPRSLNDYTEREVLAALEATDWRTSAAASRLGVARSSLYALIERMPSIRKAADLERGEIEAALEAAGNDVEAAARALRVSSRGLKLRMRQLGVLRPREGR